MKPILKRITALQPAEQNLLRRALGLLRRSPLQGSASRRSYQREVNAQLRRLNLLARAVQQAPSLYGEQRIGGRRRDVHSLIESLSQSSIFNVELHMPLRALIGRTTLMAKVNFFRLIRHVLNDAMAATPAVANLTAHIEQALCTCIYTKVAEEILTAIACDAAVEPLARRKAAAILCQLWEGRLSEQVTDFFAVLQSVWDARRRTKVVFGTLTGISELFELARAGCDGRFIDLFSQQQITQDQCMAFQEFLFLATVPELDRLHDHVRHTSRSLDPDRAAELLDSPPQRFDLSSQAAEKMYESFRRRHVAATARRYRSEGGPSRTAEEYIMLHLLAQVELDRLINASSNGPTA